ncbi:SGNH hydrolase domain-containing protein [Bradyrhizobium sp.]|uniref:SGNH hydrolase domain-containing protein n=1 Tax=Bradyrhizobium sp. TaxID=376 RepID=UPI003C6ECD48
MSGAPVFLIRRPSLSGLCVERNQRIAQRIAEASPDIVILEAIWSGDDTAEMLKPTVEALREAGIHRIIIFGTAPVWLRRLPEVVATYYRRTGNLIPERVEAYYDKHSSDALTEPVARQLGVQFISTWKPFCDRDGCLTRLGSSLVARDEIHLTPTGAQFLMKVIAPSLGLGATP